ncbi:hypothetical protein [Streptomyces sp. NPDC059753]|uniref:hypothetical protein n=1 Tax=Streptomyces sp. NPDC059753 TaxID=3346933 RepID=UPI00366130B0
MSDRYTANTITDADLDALYDRTEQAEAAIERVHALRQPFVMWRDIAAALDEPPGPAATEPATVRVPTWFLIANTALWVITLVCWAITLLA